MFTIGPTLMTYSYALDRFCMNNKYIDIKILKTTPQTYRATLHSSFQINPQISTRALESVHKIRTISRRHTRKLTHDKQAELQNTDDSGATFSLTSLIFRFRPVEYIHNTLVFINK